MSYIDGKAKTSYFDNFEIRWKAQQNKANRSHTPYTPAYTHTHIYLVAK